MIERDHGLPVTRQAQLLALSRANVYYLPKPVCASDLALMRRIDEIHLEHPFAGSRMLRDMLVREGIAVGRKHVTTLMRRMGIEALYRKANTSRRHPAHPVYPYLLRELEIMQPNHVWAMDITYIPMRRGFVYLAAVMDWASRRVLAWRVSNTLTTDFCLEAVEEAIARHGRPEIFNTDQGSQGEFNRSSQHLTLGGCDGYKEGSDRPCEDEVARAPSRCASGGTATVLGGHRQRTLERGIGPGCWRIAGGRYEMVSGVWRNAPIASFAVIATGDRTVLVFDRARADCPATCSRPRSSRDCATT